MMKKFAMPVFEEWKKCNPNTHFGLFDFLGSILQGENNELEDLLVATAQMIWPEFVLEDGHVFVKDLFSLAKYIELNKERHNPEYWMNLLLTGNYVNAIDDAIELSKLIKESWEAKLKQQFPDRVFAFELFNDEEGDDFGLTFYQTPLKE